MKTLNKLISVLFVLLYFTSCGIEPENKEFYQAYEGKDYVYTIEAQFENEFYYFSIYTKDKHKLFEQGIPVAFRIDSVVGSNIYVLQNIAIDDTDKKTLPIFLGSDTTQLGFGNYSLIKRHSYFGSSGIQSPKKWRFISLNQNLAVFFDSSVNKECLIPVSNLVNDWGTLELTGKTNGGLDFSKISYSKDGSDVKRYFDSFFKQK